MKGYSNAQIFAATKLDIAKLFLVFSNVNRMEMYQKAVDHYSMCFLYIELMFEEQEYEPVHVSDESIASFAGYCRSLGTQDSLYWQKIYTRIGLDYYSSIPKGWFCMEYLFSRAGAIIRSCLK